MWHVSFHVAVWQPCELLYTCYLLTDTHGCRILYAELCAVQWQSLEPSRTAYVIIVRAVTPWTWRPEWRSYSWPVLGDVPLLASAAGSHRTPHTRCRIVTERHQRRRKPRDPLCRRVDTMRAGRCGARGRGDVTRDHAGHLAERPVRPRPASRYKTDRLRRGAWVNCSTAVGTRRRSTAIMKSLSVLVILGVLVASTYASYVGPYRHYYVPGFQHTCVANDVQFMKNIGKHEHIKITVLNGRGQIAKSDQN